MADDYHASGKNDNAAKALGIIGIILASLALALAWLAYNRAGEDLGQQVQEGAETLQQDTLETQNPVEQNPNPTTDTNLQQDDGTTTDTNTEGTTDGTTTQ